MKGVDDKELKQKYWPWLEMAILLAVIVMFAAFAYVKSTIKPPAPAPTPAPVHAMCSKVIMLNQCTKIEKVYRHTSAPQVMNSTCVKLDEHVFCGQFVIERITDEQCKQYKDPTWTMQ